jgi:hypothetical protein
MSINENSDLEQPQKVQVDAVKPGKLLFVGPTNAGKTPEILNQAGLSDWQARTVTFDECMRDKQSATGFVIDEFHKLFDEPQKESK